MVLTFFSTHDFQVFLSFLHSMCTESSILEVYLDSLQIPIFIFSIELVLNEKKWLEFFLHYHPQVSYARRFNFKV